MSHVRLLAVTVLLATVPRAQETGPLEIEEDCFDASFGAADVTFTAPGSVLGADASVRLRLLSVGRRAGGSDLPPVVRRRVEGDVVRYERGALVEVYERRVDGLKQSFELSELPPGRGDLVVRVGIETTLPLDHADAREVLFGSEEVGVRIGGVVGVDTAGARVEGSMHWSEGTLELSLPDEFVQQASLPLVLDPLISDAAVLATFERFYRYSQQLDVAYLPGADRYYAMWTDNTGIGFAVTGVSGQLLDADGTPLGPIRNFSGSGASLGPWYDYDPHVASVPGLGRFAVAMIGGLCVSYYGYVGSVDESGNLVNFDWLIFTDLSSIDVAGDATGEENEVLVAYTALDRSVHVAEVDILTITVVQTLDLSEPQGGDFEVAIATSGGATGRYLVTWERRPSYSGPGDIWGAVVDRDLNVLAAPFPIAATAAAEADPDVDGDGTSWVVAFERVAPAGDKDIVCAGITYDPETGSVHLGNERVVERPAGLEQLDPDVAWMGESYLVAFTEQYSAEDYDVLVQSVESFGCLDCEGPFVVAHPPTPDESGAIASQRAAGGSGDEAMLAWVTTTNQIPPQGTSEERIAEAQQRIFRADDGVVDDLGGGCGHGGTLVTTCASTKTQAFGVRVRGAPPHTLARLVFGLSARNERCGSCTLVPDPIAVMATRTGADGVATISGPVPSEASLVGQKLLAQWIVAAPGGCFTRKGASLGFGFSLSNAIEITIQ